MYSKSVEIWVGIFVAAGLAALFMLAMQVSNLSTVGADEGYEISLYFDDVAGLGPRAPVRMSGVRIGRVSSIAYDQQRFQAVVKVNIEDAYRTIPEDTTAMILTEGLLGAKYIGLEPGGAMDNLAGGSEIHSTQSSLSLEKIIGQLFVKLTGGND